MQETDFSTKESRSEDDVINFYENYSVDWDSRFGDSFSTNYFIERRWRSFQEAVEVCAPKVDLAVELGVGTGVYIDRCATYFKKIIAVDGSGGMLEMLRKKIQGPKAERILLVQSNVLEIEQIEGGSVDCVYFFGLIEHIIDIDKFICEIKRLLRKDGVLIGVTPNGSSPWYSMRSFVRGTGKHCSTDKYYSIGELDVLFSDAGFERIYVSQWGVVPAGISDFAGKLLSYMEPMIERSFIKKYLGGLTFGYKLTC